MQYVTEIIINKSIKDVTKKMASVENMKHWQEGLMSMEHISGTPGFIGEKMKLNYSFGKRKMEIIKTIIRANFPNEFHATYTTKGVRNIQENYFDNTTDGFTKWTCKNNYEPTSFAMSIMLFFMPKTFKKQTKTYMNNFKKFIENGTSIFNA